MWIYAKGFLVVAAVFFLMWGSHDRVSVTRSPRYVTACGDDWTIGEVVSGGGRGKTGKGYL